MRNKKNFRTCLGCHKVLEKNNFFRIACIKENEQEKQKNDNIKKLKLDNGIYKYKEKKVKIILDESQNIGGRGAYICSIKCFEKALENNFLSKRLRINLSEKIKEDLRKRISQVER